MADAAGQPCPSCDNGRFEPLLDAGRVPKSGVFTDLASTVRPTLHLLFTYCTGCGLIRRELFEAGPPEYVDVSRQTGRRLPSYASSIVDSLSAAGLKFDDAVAEIGSNDGRFLDVLAVRGFRHVTGVEPSRSLAELAASKGHRIEQVGLDARSAAQIRLNGRFRAVICRHTIEHVADPLEFLRAIHSILEPDGLLVMELPDAGQLVSDLRIHDLWDEHLYYFTIGTLRNVALRAGFELVDQRQVRHLDSVNWLVWARASDSKVLSLPRPDASSVFASVEAFACRASANLEGPRQLFRSVTSSDEFLVDCRNF